MNKFRPIYYFSSLLSGSQEENLTVTHSILPAEMTSMESTPNHHQFHLFPFAWARVAQAAPYPAPSHGFQLLKTPELFPSSPHR